MKSFINALGIFSKIRVRYTDWGENEGPGMMICFPLVGLICGLADSAAAFLLDLTGIAPDIKGVIMLFILFAVCGFLHMDGFMDCADALLSSRDMEGKKKILKDSNVGAFAVISAGLLLISDYAAMGVITSDFDSAFILLLLAPVASRSMGALFLFAFPELETSGLLHYFRSGFQKKHIVISAFFIVASIGLGLLGGLRTFLALAAASVVTLMFTLKANKELGGINGDVIGACVIIFEGISYLTDAVLGGII